MRSTEGDVMDSKLKECPFCGASAPHTYSNVVNSKMHAIQCTECPGGITCTSSTFEQAVGAWNRRAGTPPVAAGSVDTEALRKLALAATPGDQWRMNNDGAQFGLRVNSGYQGFFNHQRPNQKCTDEVFANVAYILAAKPSVVLALLERAEKAESALAAALVLPVSIPDGEVRYITDYGIMSALDRVLGPAPAVQDAKALVDIATAVMSEHGLIDHLSESNTQKFCDALCAAIATRKVGT